MTFDQFYLEEIPCSHVFHSERLSTFIDQLGLSLSQPQRPHVVNVADALLVCEVRVMISQRHPSDKRLAPGASTDLALTPTVALKRYGRRWSCEVDNLCLKNHVGLASWRLQPYEAVDKWCAAAAPGLGLCGVALGPGTFCSDHLSGRHWTALRRTRPRLVDRGLAEGPGKGSHRAGARTLPAPNRLRGLRLSSPSAVHRRRRSSSPAPRSFCAHLAVLISYQHHCHGRFSPKPSRFSALFHMNLIESHSCRVATRER